MNETTVELLSAYLDDVLDTRERAELEARLLEDETLRRELEQMRHVIVGLRTLPRLAPPEVVELGLTRRIELAVESRGLGARLERRFPRIAEQPVIAVTFAVVLAMTAILLFFARSVDPTVPGRIPVVLDPPTPLAAEVAEAVRRTAHGTFHRVDGIWIAADVVGPPDRIVHHDEPKVAALLEDPDFARLTSAGPVRFRVGAEIWELRPQVSRD